MDQPAKLHAYLSYRDAPAALEWLERTGFDTVAQQQGADGTILHAEVRLGDIVLMIASADAPYQIPPLQGVSTGGGLYLWMPTDVEVDEWHARAIAAGAREVIGPEHTEWGTRRARVLDPEGHEWSVGTYAPGAAW